MSAPRRRARIPAGRIERLSRIGWMAGELAVGGLVEGARRWVGTGPEAGSALLSEANGKRLAKRLSTLRGAAMKLGQLLSLEGDDFLPPEFAEALAVLRADAHAMPERQLRAALVQSYGRDFEARFRSFDPEPIASASIGQVHAAVAADGRAVALKVQYPGIARSIESDVDNLATALRLARLLPGDVDLSGVVAEAKLQLRQEADYLAEAALLRRYGALLAGERALRVPAVYDDLTTRRVLAMEHLRGRPLEDVCGAEHPAGRRDRVVAVLYRLLFRELFEFRFVQTDPNFANYLWLPEGEQVALLDLGAARDVPAALADAYRRLFRAGVDDNRAGLRRAALEIGFFEPDERAERADAVVELLRLGTEPFRARGRYDFAASGLAPRVRAAGLDLAFRQGFLRPPPPETLFLHRKLAGMFLLGVRLQARVALRRELEPWLDGGAPSRAGRP